VMRVDVAYLFDLGSPGSVRAFFRGLRGIEYPRRKVSAFSLESVHCGGTTTALKLYHKGPEFRKHGKEFRKRLAPEAGKVLQEQADRRLRSEVTIKARGLQRMYRLRKRMPTVGQVSDEDLERVYREEMERFLRERGGGLEVVREQEAVHQRLNKVFAAGRRDSLFGFWIQLTTNGEDDTRARNSRSTFYRRRKDLVDSGISWHGAKVKDQARPEVLESLTVQRNDPNRCRETVDQGLAMTGAVSAPKKAA